MSDSPPTLSDQGQMRASQQPDGHQIVQEARTKSSRQALTSARLVHIDSPTIGHMLTCTSVPSTPAHGLCPDVSTAESSEPPRPATYERVLVAVGDCAHPTRALADVETLVRPQSGRVRVVHYRTWHSTATSSVRNGLPLPHDLFGETREAALELTDEMVEGLRGRGISAEGMMLESPPGGLGALIDATARDWHAEVLLLEDESAGQSISADIRAQIAHGAPCPLLIPSGTSRG